MNPQRIVIVEDESIAAQNLIRQLSSVAPSAQVLATLQTVEESVEYFSQQPMPDLVFMDIHLADGLSFHIFDQVHVDCPIIFTTAYDQYALQAFRVNSIDYLLKPISPDDLSRALSKLQRLTQSPAADAPSSGNIQSLVDMLSQQYRHYKSHFLVPVGERLVPLQVDDLAFIYLDQKVPWAYNYEGRKIALDRPLDAIMDDLDPRLFFRANRQYVVAHRAIKELSVWPIGKLKVSLCLPVPEHIIISKAKVPEFKAWYMA